MAVIKIDGIRDTVSQTLPTLELPTIPENTSNTDATEADSPFIISTDVFFNKITIAKNQSASFSADGAFHIETLDVKKETALAFAAGTYFIDTLKLDKDSVLTITSEPVVLHIGEKGEVKKDVVINVGGTVFGLQVFVHTDAEFKGGRQGPGFHGAHLWS